MENQNDSIPHYLSDLKKREAMVEKQIAKQDQHLAKMKVSSENFMQEYDKLNLLRIDLKTVQSRIEHYGEDRKGFEEKYIPGL